MSVAKLGNSSGFVLTGIISAAALIFTLFRSDVQPIFTAKTVFKIGVAPNISYVAEGSKLELSLLQDRSEVVTRISDPGFKSRLMAQIDFQPTAAPLSREMAASSLRAVALVAERDVAIEVTSLSEKDLQAVLRGLAVEIEKEHNKILSQRLGLMLADIEREQGRLLKTEERLKIFNHARDSFADKTPEPEVLELLQGAYFDITLATSLQTRIDGLFSLVAQSESSVLNVSPNSYSIAVRSVGVLRASILAGLGMLVAMIVLTTFLNNFVPTPNRPSPASPTPATPC